MLCISSFGRCWPRIFKSCSQKWNFAGSLMVPDENAIFILVCMFQSAQSRWKWGEGAIPPSIFCRNRSKTFSYKIPWITTCPPRFSKLPTASQPISPENDGKWISQKTACIYQLSISLMFLPIKTKNVAHFEYWTLKITTILSLPHKNIDSYYVLLHTFGLPYSRKF